jgi:hypothetical protein
LVLLWQPAKEVSPLAVSHRADPGFLVRRHWLRASAVAAMVFAAVVIPSAGRAAPDVAATSAASAVLAGQPSDELTRLEAQAAGLTTQFRGQLELLTQTESAAKATLASALQLRRQVSDARQQVARIAVASYMDTGQDPALVMLAGGDAQRMLQKASILQYLGQQRIAKEQTLSRLMVAAQRAEQAAQAKIAGLRRLLATLTSQRQKIAALMAKFRPQSPVIGDNITPRMRQVKDEIDRRFGPFIAIGCYRPGTDGEHPLGRACDFMLSSGGVMPVAANVQLGYQVATWAQANASRLGIMYIIYRQRIWDIRIPSAGWVLMPDRGGITANHFDHVHISVF